MMNRLDLPSAEAVERVRSGLTKRLEVFRESKILGAELGGMLNSELAPTSYKSWLNGGNQNLRSFAEAFLTGIVTPTQERRGLDYLFQIEGRSQKFVQTFSGALWKSFCTTRPSNVISFDPNLGALILSEANGEQVTPGIVIPSLSDVELKAMCLEFAESLDNDSPVGQRAVQAATAFEPRAYSEWVSMLKAERGLFKAWGAFRVSRIKTIFSQRVEALTGDYSTRERLKSEFDADYESQRANKSTASAAKSRSTDDATVSVDPSPDAKRELLLRALGLLDNEQLAQILVPLNIVAGLLVLQKRST